MKQCFIISMYYHILLENALIQRNSKNQLLSGQNSNKNVHLDIILHLCFEKSHIYDLI